MTALEIKEYIQKKWKNTLCLRKHWVWQCSISREKGLLQLL